MKATKSTKKPLTEEIIINASLALIKEIGLEKFSMRKLGQKLGVSPMAIYRYFPNQGQLFDRLVEKVWQQALTISSDLFAHATTWQDKVVALMLQVKQTLIAYQELMPLISTHPLATKKEFVLIEQVLLKLKEGMAEFNKNTVFLLNSLVFYTIGYVWAEAVEPKEGGEVNVDLMAELQQGSPIFQELFSALLGEERHDDQQFLMGINAILNGWQ
ncbi:TetR/AcrR family transcriptional regulator [Lactobacillus sp. ESL0731]|uniref:TetR/AcrR family transcriptional regulator n=1 Tax=unclassified Lactobacillus TaxID=2620435 RepID=UPI0023F9586F|nr:MULTISPECIES: TetR/AcrR family transcriptional regulator [unclassified Lactobacillus]WEV51180.1 TetR/AcrR family transcriptional regulator [Lactobacillus sp. ESL0700]WEV62310.1 TetR/AcrR family transcriptional regulator [Lactobacillus sp. ESL0731]